LPKPIRLPLLAQPSNRGTTAQTDASLINTIVEKTPVGDLAMSKRPGFRAFALPLTGTVPHGIYITPNLQGVVYWIYDTTLYSNATGTPALGTVANNPLAPVNYWFDTTLGTPSYVYLSNGSNAYYVNIATNTLTPITDANYPALTVYGSCYLDGTLYVMDGNSRIWGSKNLNDPSAWDALNVIVAQNEADNGTAIAKQLIYVVAFKRWTTEFFYDAANPVGTPLLPLQNAKLPIGCTSASTIQRIDDELFWVGSGRETSFAVYRLVGLKHTRISTEPIERLIAAASPSNSFAVSTAGHSYYCLQCTGPAGTFGGPASAGAASAAGSGSGTPVVFIGLQPPKSPLSAPSPPSLQATITTLQTTFFGAITQLGLNTYEGGGGASKGTGSFTYTGGTATFTSAQDTHYGPLADNSVIVGAADSSPSLGRYNMTPGVVVDPAAGDTYGHWLQSYGSFTYVFSTLLNAFSIYLTDLGDFRGTLVINFYNGSTLVYSETGISNSLTDSLGRTNGNLTWYGIISPTPFNKLVVTITQAVGVSSYDFIGFDQMVVGTYVSPATIPSGTAATLVYDIREDVWMQWNWKGDKLPISGVSQGVAQSTLPITFYTFDFRYLTDIAAVGDEQPVVSDIITPTFDSGHRFMKYLAKMRFAADQQSMGHLKVRWSDDDYRTWSPWRYVNLQEDAPQLFQLGSFRKRAFWFRHESPNNFRITSVDMEILEGDS